jgi:hypothetical protein
VRLHFKPSTGMDASLEGVLTGRFGGGYVLLRPSLIEGEAASVALQTVEIPRVNVLFWERLQS